MAKKKSVRKRKSSKVVASKRLVRSTKKKINLVLKNLILFGVLSIISFMLYTVSSSEFYTTLFSFSAMIFGIIDLSFLIVLLIFLILKAMEK